MPELPNRLQQGTTFEQAMPLLNDVFNAIDDENRTKVIRNGNVPQVLFGYQKDGFGLGVDYGLKVSRIDQATGIAFDVTTATDEQLQFTTAQDTRLFYNQHVPQVLIGYQDNGFGTGYHYGMKASKTNPDTGLPYDVRTATSDQLNFSTGFNQLKIADSDTVVMPVTSFGGDLLITHGLGVVPVVIAYTLRPFDGAIVGDYWVQVPYYELGGGSEEMAFAINENELYFYLFNEAGGLSVDRTIKYYLLTETLA